MSANSSARSPAERPLWTCPDCGKRFVTANMWHSCGRYSEDTFFAGKTEPVRRLYEAVKVFVGGWVAESYRVGQQDHLRHV